MTSLSGPMTTTREDQSWLSKRSNSQTESTRAGMIFPHQTPPKSDGMAGEGISKLTEEDDDDNDDNDDGELPGDTGNAISSEPCDEHIVDDDDRTVYSTELPLPTISDTKATRLVARSDALKDAYIRAAGLHRLAHRHQQQQEQLTSRVLSWTRRKRARSCSFPTRDSLLQFSSGSSFREGGQPNTNNEVEPPMHHALAPSSILGGGTSHNLGETSPPIPRITRRYTDYPLRNTPLQFASLSGGGGRGMRSLFPPFSVSQEEQLQQTQPLQLPVHASKEDEKYDEDSLTLGTDEKEKAILFTTIQTPAALVKTREKRTTDSPLQSWAKGTTTEEVDNSTGVVTGCASFPPWQQY